MQDTTLAVNATGLVQDLLHRYQIWLDYQKFYHHIQYCPVRIDAVGISTYHYTDIKAINSDNGSVVFIDCLSEGIHALPYFQQYLPNKQYVFFSCGRWDTEHWKLGIDYELIAYEWFLFDHADTHLSPHRFSSYIDKEYKFDYPKPCQFVSTIGLERPERSDFVEQLQQSMTDRNYILRYCGKDLGQPSDHDVVTFGQQGFDPYTDLLPKYYHNVSATVPIDLYNQGYFNIVVETEIDFARADFVTEKILKCLTTGMPFIVLANQNFLKRLHELGFETYYEFWDESYDTEACYRARIKKIVDLVSHLSKFDWSANRDGLQRIKLENRNNFFRTSRIAQESFMTMHELFTRLQAQG